jgi:DNA-binding transcriptional LysR family regulator
MVTPGLPETTALMAVIEQKSFTKAAKQLGLSPARVSELVRNLEARLGVRLVERTTRSVAATIAGERLLERLRPVLEEYRSAFDMMNDFRSRPAGTLRLTVAPFAADFVVAPMIAGFLAQYPEISLDISVDRAFVDIVEERYDAGIRQGERLARDMIAVRISRHACIRFRSTPSALMPWRFARKRRTFEVQVEGHLTTNELTIAISAALNGAGLIQLPRAYLAADLAAKRLVTVLDDWARPAIDGFFLYYSSRRQIRTPLKALVDYLREGYRGRAAGRRAAAPMRASEGPLSA